MAKKKYLKQVGGFKSIKYTLSMAQKSGHPRQFYQALKSQNTCKACALGMSAMKNELGEGLQVCKKSMQATAQDLQPGIDPDFFLHNSIHQLGALTGRELEATGRLAQPLLLRDGQDHYHPINWEKAYEYVIDSLKTVDPDRSFFYTSGRSSNEAAFLIQIFARQFGTNNINNCSYYCHQASGVGLKQTIGSGTSTVTLEDVGKADLVVLIGANPSSNHPRFITHLADLRKRSGKVVIINPFQETGLKRFKVPSKLGSFIFGSKISDLYLQPHCGGDMAFLKAIMAYLLQEKKVSLNFISQYCNNVEDFTKDLENANIEELLTFSGIFYPELEKLCKYLLESENTIFSWAMGATHHVTGVQTVRSIANLSLLLGQIGKSGRGLLPLRGHSNVQGVGTVGVVPNLPPKVIENLAKNFNIKIPEHKGKDTFACMQAAHRGEFDLAIMLGGNLYGANPNSKWAKEALSKIDTTIYISTTLNLGHFHGRGKNTLILPVRVRDEEKQFTTQESMFSYVRLSVGGFAPPVDSLPSESEILSNLGKELFGDTQVPWSQLADHQEIRQFIAKTVPNLESIAKISGQGGSFTIPGRIKHEPVFNTPNQKANLFVGVAPDARPEIGTYNLLTFRSEGQFNTIVYEDEDVFRGVKHRNVVFMNQEDIEAKNLKDGDIVTVTSDVGTMNVELIEGPIRQGNVAMYFPEANILVPGKVDPQSKTPSFKRTRVKIDK